MVKKRKQSTDTTQNHKKHKKKPSGIATAAPLPPDPTLHSDDDTDDMQLDDDDLNLLSLGTSNLNFLRKLPKEAMDKHVTLPRSQKHQSHKGNNTSATINDAQATHDENNDDDDEEGEEWERGPRRRTSEQQKLTADPLPIKTLNGEIIRNADKARARSAALLPASKHLAAAVSGVTIHDDLEEALKKKVEEINTRKERELEEEARAKKKADEDGKRKYALQQEQSKTFQILHEACSSEQRRAEAKRVMAVAAQSILSNPEANIAKHLRTLLLLLSDKDGHVVRLSMLTLLAVMKDLIPGYKIRPLLEKETADGVTLSKEVKKLWEYESTLLKGYQAYLKSLLQAVNNSRHTTRSGRGSNTTTQPTSSSSRNTTTAVSIAHGRVAIKCLSTLLSTAPHFNYASDVLQAVVLNMVNKDEHVRQYCCTAVSLLVRTGMDAMETGGIAVEAVQLVADLVKRRQCVVPSETVLCLLGLSFPEISSGEDFEAAKASRKKKKGKKKGKKKADDVDKSFAEAQAVADRDQRRSWQSAALEALFEIFFRVVKTAAGSSLIAGALAESPPMSSSRCTKKFPLLPVTMVGMSTFAHLISVDYFNDMMTAVEDLLSSSALPPDLRLRCILTAAEILQGQGEALTVDRRTFYVRLYSALMQSALVPLDNDDDDDDDDHDCGGGGGTAMKEINTPPPITQQQQQQQQTSIPQLLARLLQSMLVESKVLDSSRQAAFVKRATILILCSNDPGVAMGLLCVLQRLLRKVPALRGMLHNEAGGPVGVKSYRPDIEDPAEASAVSVPLWELSLLSRHYHPHVSRAAKEISLMNSSSGGTTLLPLGTLPDALAVKYTSSRGGFFPVPQTPGIIEGGNKKKKRKHETRDGSERGSDFWSNLESQGTKENNTLEEGVLRDVLKKHFVLNKQCEKNGELRRSMLC